LQSALYKKCRIIDNSRELSKKAQNTFCTNNKYENINYYFSKIQGPGGNAEVKRSYKGGYGGCNWNIVMGLK
jgi:hypothetical protein